MGPRTCRESRRQIRRPMCYGEKRNTCVIVGDSSSLGFIMSLKEHSYMAYLSRTNLSSKWSVSRDVYSSPALWSTSTSPQRSVRQPHNAHLETSSVRAMSLPCHSAVLVCPISSSNTLVCRTHNVAPNCRPPLRYCSGAHFVASAITASTGTLKLYIV